MMEKSQGHLKMAFTEFDSQLDVGSKGTREIKDDTDISSLEW